VPQEQPSDDDPKSYKTNYQKKQVGSFKWSRHLSTTFGSINETIFHILTSFDNVKNLDNKGEKKYQRPWHLPTHVATTKDSWNSNSASLQHGRGEWKYWDSFILSSISIKLIENGHFSTGPCD
jgi:hypothetical protein